MIAILLITILTVIIMVLAVICIQRGLQVSSLKKQVSFLEESLRQLTEIRK